jgi:hypothetical protein
MKNRLFNRRKTSHTYLSQKILLVLSIIPILSIFIGTDTIIAGFSPLYLSNSTSLINGFVNNFSGHAFILIGALLVTAIIWDLTHDSWDNEI